MKAKIQDLSLKVDISGLTAATANYRPPSWPPQRDWPVVIDRLGTVVSVWGDPIWDLTPWAGKPMALNFGDGEAGRSKALDPLNADLLRLAMSWLIWGPRSYRTAGTIKNRFSALRVVFELCASNGISAASLQRFPKVLEQISMHIAHSKWDETISLLHRLYDARDELGFEILDPGALKRLAELADEYTPNQTPYIPPRIWTYQLKRLRECLDDYAAHKAQIQACFQYCLDAYSENFGSLEAALQKDKKSWKGPFTANSQGLSGCEYLGPFENTAAKFGIDHLLTKWIIGDRKRSRASMFSAYLTLVTIAGLAYIANYTLQRKEEVAGIRSSCLVWEHDEKLGRIAIICGATTKTDPDSDARWIASPSVEIAVDALRSIASLRMTCDASIADMRSDNSDLSDPYLFSAGTEPWSVGVPRQKDYYVRRPLDDLRGVVSRYPLLFDEEQLRIEDEDLQIARRITPDLPEEEFAVGLIWPLAWHQYRRTAAVNMFASGVVSDSSMQQQMKHATRLMPLYYGQGHTRLHLNEEVEQAVTRAMYEATAERLKAVVTDRFVSPHSEERKEAIAVNLLGTKDVKTLIQWAKDGKVSFREHRLGGCMKAGPCEYGGVESVARCGGGDGAKPCSDVVFDRKKESQVRAQLSDVTKELALCRNSEPRRAALVAEANAMKNYLNVVTAVR